MLGKAKLDERIGVLLCLTNVTRRVVLRAQSNSSSSFVYEAFFHRELGKGTTGDALRKFLGGGPVSNQVKYEMTKQGLDQEGPENEGLTQKFRTSSSFAQFNLR